MTSLRDQQKLDGDVAPLIINVCNFSKGTDGQPSLLSPDDARTLFHESAMVCTACCRTSCTRRCPAPVCSPISSNCRSQLYEHWQERPEVLQKFARHYQTDEPLPEDLLKRFIAARKFNQGFATVEFVSSALMDLEFHTQPAASITDVRAFEKQELDKIGMPAEIALRHRAAAVRSHILRRSLCVGLLQLHVVRSDGRGRVRRIRGSPRHLRSGGGEASARRYLFVGRITRS